jgi:hypothetical protein
MNDRQKEYFHKLYQPLVGGKIVGFRIDEDSFGMSPFPVFILNVHGQDFDCAISADEEGNGGGFMFIEEHDTVLGGKTQKGSRA